MIHLKLFAQSWVFAIILALLTITPASAADSASTIPQTSTATVTAHHPGKGRYEGIMGSLSVRSAQHGDFKLSVGFNKNQRITPPAIGSTVSYKYKGEFASGKPRYPTFISAQ